MLHKDEVTNWAVVNRQSYSDFDFDFDFDGSFSHNYIYMKKTPEQRVYSTRDRQPSSGQPLQQELRRSACAAHTSTG
jgi:hypothetical protein